MNSESTARTAANTTEANPATYVEAAGHGKPQWWRYLLGLVVILFSWLIVGSGASLLVAFALGGQANPSVLSSVEYFLFVMVSFLFFFAGVLLAVSLIHRRHPRTLITARERIDWWRVGQGCIAWSVPLCLVGGLGQYLLYPDTFSLNADLVTFARFVPIALVFIAIQTTTEELFFRGYIMQGASVVWSNRIFLALASAVVFTIPHLLNPEAIAGSWLTIFFNYFVGSGLVWAVVSLIDGTTELAIGAHFANNIVAILMINTAGSAVNAPSLFVVSEFHATFVAVAVLVIIPLFLAIAYGVFKRKTPARSPAQPTVSSATPVEF